MGTLLYEETLPARPSVGKTAVEKTLLIHSELRMLRAVATKQRGCDASHGQPTSAVRQVLLAMHQEQASGTPPTNGLEKLKSTISKLRDAKDPAADAEAKVVQDHLVAQLKAVHRALSVVSGSVEEEVGALRATNAKMWDQLCAERA